MVHFGEDTKKIYSLFGHIEIWQFILNLTCKEEFGLLYTCNVQGVRNSKIDLKLLEDV